MADRGERWVLTVQLPSGVPNPARFVARLLKHLLRAWGIPARPHEDAVGAERRTAIGRTNAPPPEDAEEVGDLD
jgi:hypothetical protein